MYQIFNFDVRKGELKILSVFNTALEAQLRTRLALKLDLRIPNVEMRKKLKNSLSELALQSKGI